ncbi:MAG: AAA domain-containing protein [Bacteroidota bacterium]|nr:AAA domain-containing protein [Bacteroidota bacterium]
MKDILQSYLKRLTNLSGNNRSLLLLKLNVEQFIDLHDLDHVNGVPSWQIMEHLITRKSQVKLVPQSDARDELSNKIAARLKKLNRREKFLFEESGARDMYVGWPFVEGKFNDGTILRAPLCFFPVELQLEKDHWALSLKKDVNISFNKSLLLAFSHYNQIEVKEELVEHSFDDYDRHATTFKNQLYEQISASSIDIPFSREFYAEQLEPFPNKVKDQLEQTYDVGELSLKMQAVLGLFPQADSYLVPDYDFLLETNPYESLEQFFEDRVLRAETPDSANFDPETFFLSSVKEDETYTPFPLDAHQENALKAVKKGGSIVVQGPPGTGKSQLICNLVSDFIARGKKVLVVSQKRAALDVVYHRLKEHEIHEFAALVHDFKADRKEIYDKIARQIDRLQEYKRSNNNLDALQLDRQFRQASLTIEENVEQLEEYKAALFDNSECGLSVKELYLTSSPEAAHISMVQEYSDFHFKKLDKFLKKLELYFDYANELDSDEHPWSDRVSFAGFRASDLQEILSCLDEIPKEARAIARQVSEIIGEEVDYDACRTISENLERLREINAYLKNEEIYRLFRPMTAFPNAQTELLWLKNTRNLLNKCFEGNGVEQTIPANEIGEVQQILKQRSDAKNSAWKSFKWRFSKEKLRLARILVANGLRDDKAALRILTERIDNRLNLQHQLTKLRSVGWINSVPKTLSQEEINQWIDHLEMAVNGKLRFNSFANFNEYFKLNKLSAKEFRSKIKELRKALEPLPARRSRWNKYIEPPQIDRLLVDEDFLKALRKSVKRDFETLCELDKLRESFSDKELAIVDRLGDMHLAHKKEVLQVFDNSLRLAWIDHIESKNPILRAVSTLKFDRLISELREAVEQKAEASNQILLQKARERTYEGIEFNRLNNMVTYRELLHQVTKKRKIWPVRRVINHFYQELFNLVPCWLASPESVSAIFPMESVFDLVIFDEASQCFAEKGLPAIYRGKQVVVAGDDQQLKPNDLYRVRWEDDSEEVALEVESLLELSRNFLMQVHLRGHYRSQSQELIQFSNEHFYQNKLTMLPHFDVANGTEPAIEYIKVKGRWEKQSNLEEAREVVEVVKSFLRKKTEYSLGVVTFNAVQQGLIIDLLEEEGLMDKGSLFVKNIENVQGDERDVIIFSTGYAPDANGKMNVQFGSLNQVGGENRLNVAITRARQKVVIVTSILPSQLKVEDTRNEGPKMLKAYLKYAKQVSDKEMDITLTIDKGFEQEWYLKNKLIALEGELPVKMKSDSVYADIALMRRNKYLGLIFTDDNSFYVSTSVKESFVYRPALLSAKAWPYRLMHSRDYWQNGTNVKDKISRFIELVDSVR